jgi:hypothetical protein
MFKRQRQVREMGSAMLIKSCSSSNFLAVDSCSGCRMAGKPGQQPVTDMTTTMLSQLSTSYHKHKAEAI